MNCQPSAIIRIHLATGSFGKGSLRPALRGGRPHHLLCSETLLCRRARHLCPTCISTGRAAKSLKQSLSKMLIGKGSWIRKRPGPLQSNLHGYISWQGEYWLSCYKTTVPIWGQLALVNWKKWALLSKS